MAYPNAPSSRAIVRREWAELHSHRVLRGGHLPVASIKWLKSHGVKLSGSLRESSWQPPTKTGILKVETTRTRRRHGGETMSGFRRTEVFVVFLVAVLAVGLLLVGLNRDRTVVDAKPERTPSTSSASLSSTTNTTPALITAPTTAASVARQPTAAPTTTAPTTAAPTTAAPTTAAPTTAAPTTAAPTTAAPTTAAPTTQRKRTTTTRRRPPTTRPPTTAPPTQPPRTFPPPTWTVAP